jgi:hypothetical protein
MGLPAHSTTMAQDWDNTIEMKVKKKYKDLFQKNKMLKDEIEKKIYLKKD